MLPAIVLILFFNGAISAANMIISQTNETKRILATGAALALLALPAWQTIEVVNRGIETQRSLPGMLRGY